eukprot:c15768_g3_i1 orf=2-184(-)
MPPYPSLLCTQKTILLCIRKFTLIPTKARVISLKYCFQALKVKVLTHFDVMMMEGAHTIGF